ncbi:MAG: folylpolyglutamate synthase/dihydrofolate synthase family protein [Bacillota bacterium]
MKYDDAIAFLTSGEGEIIPGIERISSLIQSLSNPHAGMKIVHIAGTNGKGSVAAFVSSVLTEAGFIVGKFNSPWISNINEVVLVGEEKITDQEICDIAEEMFSVVGECTAFEKLTALAFCHFRNRNCQYVVLEAGMGGAFDATNFINTSVVSVITKVSIDHQSFLGETLAEIAKHKAGIIKTGCPVICAPQEFVVSEAIKKVAVSRNSKLTFLNINDLTVIEMNLNGSRFYLEGKEYVVSLVGEHQIENAFLAVKVLNLLDIDYESIRIGLSKTTWAGRFQIICRQPWVILDGAHNVEGMKVLVSNLKLFFSNQKIIFVFGALKDKEVKKMTSIMAEVAGEIHTVSLENRRAFQGKQLAEFVRIVFENVYESDNINDAIKIVMEKARKEEVIVACGSLFLGDKFDTEVCKYVF